MRVTTSPRRQQQPQLRVGRALWFAGFLTLMLVTVDYRAMLIEPSTLRYAILFPPIVLMALAAGRTAPLRLHRLHPEDWLLLGLAVLGSVGGLYGKFVNHVPSPAIVAFGPMLFFGFLHLFVHEPPDDEAAAGYLRVVRNLMCFYVLLHVLASTGVVPMLARYDSYRFEKGFLIAMALVACVVSKKYGRLALLVAAALAIFANYPAATYVIIGAGTLVVLLLTSRRRSHAGLALFIVLAAASFSLYVTSHGVVKSTSGYFQSVGKQDNSDTRLALWQLAIKQIDRSPVYGHLFTNDLSLSVPISLTGFTRVEPHNDYLQVAMQGGLLALAAYVAWILLAIRRALQIYRRLLAAGRDESAKLVRVLLVGFNGFFLMSLVNPGLSELGLAASAFIVHSMIRTLDIGPVPAALDPDRGLVAAGATTMTDQHAATVVELDHPDATRRGAGSFQAMSRAVRRPETRRTMWSILDQGVSSIGNLALSVLVARYSTPREFGAFGLAFATYLLLLGASRGLCSLPLTLRFSAEADDIRRVAARDSVGLAAGFALATAPVVLVVGVAAGGAIQRGLLPLALITPALLLQDSWRYAFFAMATPIQAMWNDIVWTLAQVVMFAVLIVSGHATVTALLLAWGAGAAIAAAFGVFQSRLWPSLVGGWHWLGRQRDIAPALTLESIAVSGSSQLTLFCVAAAGGLIPVAALRSAQVVLGPIAMLFTGVVFAMAPEAVRLHKRAPHRLLEFTLLASTGLALVAVVGGAASMLIPAAVGRVFLGDNWAIGRPLLLPLTLGLAATGALIGAMVGLRVLLAAKRTLVLRLILLVLSMLAGSVGVIAGGAAGAQLGMSLAACVVTVVAWVWFRRVAAADVAATTERLA